MDVFVLCQINSTTSDDFCYEKSSYPLSLSHIFRLFYAQLRIHVVKKPEDFEFFLHDHPQFLCLYVNLDFGISQVESESLQSNKE